MTGVAAGVIAAMVGLPLLLLAVPVHVMFRLERVETVNGRIAVRWMFGLVHWRVRVPDAGRPTLQPVAAPRVSQAGTPGQSRSGVPDVLALLRQTAFRQRVYRLLADGAGALHLHRLRLYLRLGLGDPADTGQLWALMGPLNALAQNLRHVRVRIEPEFMQTAFEFQACGRLRVMPLRLVLLAVGFVLSPVCVRAWHAR